jgi:hypothetical protein
MEKLRRRMPMMMVEGMGIPAHEGARGRDSQEEGESIRDRETAAMIPRPQQDQEESRAEV